MMKKFEMTPLVLKNSSTSIYFNFGDGKLYEVKFAGALIQVFSGNQKTNTFLLSLLIIYVIAPVTIFSLNQFILRNRLISFVLAVVLGLAIGYFLVKIVLSEIVTRKQVLLSKLEIEKIYKRAIRGGRLLNLTLIFCIFFLIISLLVALSSSKQGFSKLIFYNGASGFVISAIVFSSHPSHMIKGGKILKRQLKEGKFDD
ncbi:hypothetical protein [Lactovum odontotermitis]